MIYSWLKKSPFINLPFEIFVLTYKSGAKSLVLHQDGTVRQCETVTDNDIENMSCYRLNITLGPDRQLDVVVDQNDKILTILEIHHGDYVEAYTGSNCYWLTLREKITALRRLAAALEASPNQS